MTISSVSTLIQNSFLLSKFLREKNIEADCFDRGDEFLHTPYWEDAVFSTIPEITSFIPGSNGRFIEKPSYNSLKERSFYTDWERPEWSKIVGSNGMHAYYDYQHIYDADKKLGRKGFAFGPMPPDYYNLIPRPTNRYLPFWESLQVISNLYDLLVLFGPLAIHGISLPKGRSYITFEHSTMRNAKQENPLLWESYKRAKANIITNPDVLRNVDRQELAPCYFLPHPHDTDKFSPGEKNYGFRDIF